MEDYLVNFIKIVWVLRKYAFYNKNNILIELEFISQTKTVTLVEQSKYVKDMRLMGVSTLLVVSHSPSKLMVSC